MFSCDYHSFLFPDIYGRNITRETTCRRLIIKSRDKITKFDWLNELAIRCHELAKSRDKAYYWDELAANLCKLLRISSLILAAGYRQFYTLVAATSEICYRAQRWIFPIAVISVQNRLVCPRLTVFPRINGAAPESQNINKRHPWINAAPFIWILDKRK